MKILFFTPFSAIWEHSVQEFYLARNFAENGHDVHYYGCGKGYSYCNLMDGCKYKMLGDEAEKAKLCSRCVAVFKDLASHGSFSTSFLSENTSNEEIATLVKKARESNVKDSEVVIDGAPFGKFAIYETVLRYKKQTDVLSTEEEKDYFYSHVYNSLRSYLSMKRHLETHTYDRVVIFSPQYAANRSVAYLFEQRGIPVYFIESGTNVEIRLKTLRCWKWDASYLVNPLLKLTNDEIDKLAFSEEELTVTTRHFKRLIEASSHMVYSQKKSDNFDFYKFFPQAKGKKVVLATMSSFDEAFAAYLADLFPKLKACSLVYPVQVDWIKDLIRFVGTQKDIFLIVRVHPRDFPNKRENHISDQGRALMSIFKNADDALTANVAVNWPEENISLYDILCFTDLLTTGWSVTAMEAGMLGIPVATYDKNLPSYPASAVLMSSSAEEYHENILKGLRAGWSFQNVVKAYNWLALNHNYGALKISDTITNYENGKKPLFYRITDKICRILNYPNQAKRFLADKDSKAENLDLIRNLIEAKLDHYMQLPPLREKLLKDAPRDLSPYKKQLRMLFNSLKSANQEETASSPLTLKMRLYLDE